MLRIAAGLALVYALVCAAAWALQRKLLYFPGYAPTPVFPAGLDDLEEVSVTTEDGLALTGWWWPRAGAPTLLVFGGNSSNRQSWLETVRLMRAQLDVSVLLADYRGYGGNPGSPTEDGLARDATAWEAWLAPRATGPVVYLGQSLGSGVAVELASRRPPAALVLESPFTSVVDVGAKAYPFLPVRLLGRDRFESLARIGEVTCPLLVLHGEADTLVPPAHGAALVEAAGGPARYVPLPGVGHEGLLLADEERWVAAVRALLDDLPSR